MLILERNENGRTIVRLHKDWHPGRIGQAYIPKQPNHLASRDAARLQAALLRKHP